MDPRQNPYSPGAGAPPPELAGRKDILNRASIMLDRIRSGLSARGFVFYGLRGVGKTVLLNEIRRSAERDGFLCVQMEAPETRSLPALLAPPLRAALIKLSAGEALRSGIKKALTALAGFANAMKLKYKDLELAMDIEPRRGVADSGDIESDLTELLENVGAAAAERKTAAVLFIDEIQYVKENELAALIMALHRASQNQVPLTMISAGLPQIISQMGQAKSYAERLFEFLYIDRLDERSARDALCVPARKEGVKYAEDAVAAILRETKGYPYFLQEWGKHGWDIAAASPIRIEDAQKATKAALAELDNSFFRVRFDRLTPSEKTYMRAMAELGPGPHRSGDIANLLHRAVTSAAPTRNALISKGMIYSPTHGDTAFTVPLFDNFMKRIMPTLKK